MRQIHAIAWAQWRTWLNFYRKGHRALALLTIIASLAWYGMSVFGAVALQAVCASPEQLPLVARHGAQALFLSFVYWQIAPIVMASTGMALDLKRLAVYPITKNEMFLAEVLLRFSTGLEMLIILTGVTIGLLRNPVVPKWAPLVFLPWLAFNLLLSAGVRDLLSRLLARRRTRELAMIAFVMIVALPQLLVVTGIPAPAREAVTRLGAGWWPWRVTARLALNGFDARAAAALLGWVALAAWFGRWQFERGFRFDPEAASATPSAPPIGGGWRDWLYRLPSRVFADPVAAVMEKEFRSLCRAPRFRLVFLMGFTFGVAIWLPVGARGGDSFFSTYYLTMVSFYALALLGEVCFWNTFGFDRGAVQLYYVTGAGFRRVLMAKNLVALTFVGAEVLLIALTSSLIHAPVTFHDLLETTAAMVVATVYLLAAGNLVSLAAPRPVDPGEWRTVKPSRMQMFLFLLYPALAGLVALAYLARFAFDTELAFYGAVLVEAALAAIVYWVALDSASRLAADRRETIVATLSAREGPVAG